MSKNFISGWEAFSNKLVIQTQYSDPLDISLVNDLSIDVSADVQVAASKTFVSGTAELATATFPAKAAIASGDYIVIKDMNGHGWAVYADKTGADVEPTGAAWTAILAARKSKVDLQAAVSAADVAAAFEVAFNALVDFSSVVTTDDTAADGTMKFTQVKNGHPAAPVVKNADDSGAGTIAVVVTTPGTATNINLDNEHVTVSAHGYTTGQCVRVTTDGALPTGLAGLTDYYLIVVDADTLAFASSLLNANAGTAINLTGYGTGTQTIAPEAISGGSVQLQRSSNKVTWYDVSGKAVAIAADTDGEISVEDAAYKFVRLAAKVTKGKYVVNAQISAKAN